MARPWYVMHSKIRASVHERGIAGTVFFGGWRFIRRRWRALQELFFDLRHGVQTRGLVWLDEHSGEEAAYAHATQYQGVGAGNFRQDIAALGVDVREFVFIDIGCGRGKALVLASEYPFERVVGVELDPELTETAESNMQRLRQKGTPMPPVEVVCIDAAKYEFPPTSLIVFLNNPFDETILGLVMDQLQSCLTPDQEAIVIYEAPFERQVTDASSFLEIERELGHSVVYRSRLAELEGEVSRGTEIALS